jgi:hypothetical protein
VAAHNGALSVRQRVAMTPRTAKAQGRAAPRFQKSSQKCAYRPRSFAAREVGCPLGHCECGTHDVEHDCDVLPDDEPTAAFPRVHQRGGFGIDVKLTHMGTTRDVFWSPRIPTGGGCNSYVLCEPLLGGTSAVFRLPGGAPVQLFSVNGIGEIRWGIEPHRVYDTVAHLDAGHDWAKTGEDYESLLAARHFGLVFVDVGQGGGA